MMGLHGRRTAVVGRLMRPDPRTASASRTARRTDELYPRRFRGVKPGVRPCCVSQPCRAHLRVPMLQGGHTTSR